MDISLSKFLAYGVMMALIVVLGQWYKSRSQKGSATDARLYQQIIERHKFGVDTDLAGKTPIWVPVVHEENGRAWPSFGSRVTKEVNQPYLSLCIETLVKNAGSDYQVVVLDDSSYGRLIPGWDIDLSMVSDPMRRELRTLALWKVLYYYGGVLCPPSTICVREFDTIVSQAQGKCFSVETTSTALSDNLFEANPRFMGCNKEDSCMQSLIQELEKVLSGDCTDAVDFDGDIPALIARAAAKGCMVVLDGSVVGVKTDGGCPVLVDDLFEGVQFPAGVSCIVLPQADISSRTAYGWFPRLSAEQVIQSQVPFVEYFRLALGR